MHKTFTFDACRDGNLYGEEFIAGTREEAERQAVAALNDDWHENYASYEDMAEDMDGCAIIEHPAIMAPRLPQDTIYRYRRLAVGLRDMIDGQRIDATMLPDDFLWLSLALDDLAMIDAPKQATAASGDHAKGQAEAVVAEAIELDPLNAAARALCYLTEDALFAHIYGDDPIPANCTYVAAIQRVRQACGLPDAVIRTTPVWRFSASFANEAGFPSGYSTEVVSPALADAFAEGQARFLISHPKATAIKATVRMIAGDDA